MAVEIAIRLKEEGGKVYTLTDYIFTDRDGDHIGVTAHRELPDGACNRGCNVKVHWTLATETGGCYASSDQKDVELFAWLLGQFAAGVVPTPEEVGIKYLTP